ncbi:MAG: beta-ketoacyl-[acyl-carrier-protein] synthase family protein [Armatimonadota bacterium]
MKSSLLSPQQRVVITGLGVVAPNGIGKKAFWEALSEGRSGVDWITGFDTTHIYCKIAGEIHNFEASDYRPAKHAARSGRFSNYAVAAAQLAVADADVELSTIDPYRMGCIFGTNMAGVGSVSDDLYALLHRQNMSNAGMDLIAPSETSAHAATSNVAIELGLRGPNTTSGAGCAATLDAINSCVQILRSGNAKLMVAGATESLVSQVGMATLAAQKVFTRRNDPPQAACRPFDKTRDGLVLSEGSAAVILETADHAMERGAHIYAEVLGFGATTEAQHLLFARSDGEDMAQAFRRALLQAKISYDEIDYICAHGISNKQYDLAETVGIKKVMGERAYNVPVSSVKSMTGQPFGPGGGWQVVASCMSIEDGLIAPTINYHEPDPDCDLDYVPNVARRARVDTVLVNSHAGGGTHACMLLRRFE